MKFRRIITLTTLLLVASINMAWAAEAVFRIVAYNKTTGEFELAPSGLVPQNAWAYFENDFGATIGNRYNQIPRNRSAALHLEGWKGCTIHSITLSLCSNNQSGQLGLSLTDGETALYNERPTDFAGDAWFGQWVSKDLGVYVDIVKPLTTPMPLTTDACTIALQGGTSEGSVYVHSITINYDGPQNVPLTSPLGWTYEKLTAKSTLNVGDELMLYRNGCAAADIDGIETAHYLDAVALASTSNVNSPEVLRFTLGKSDTASLLWTLTNQYGQMLAANGKQSLTWDEGSALWQITLGYDGATLTNDAEGYGTLRFNAPAESYARFALYTSKSLPLPYLYRKAKQNAPVVCTNIAFAEPTQSVSLDEGHIALPYTLSPTNATDQRVLWTSSAPDVATVNGGYITLHGAGQTFITATTCDGGAEATLQLTVTGGISAINTPTQVGTPQRSRKQLKNHRIIISNGTYHYNVNGQRI